MSASYIHRDPLVLNPNAPQVLSSRIGVNVGHNDYLSLSASDNILGQGHRAYESRAISAKSSPPMQTQVSLQSPKMSPDSTLTHLPSQSAASVPRFPSPSTGFCTAGATTSPLCDGFLRSALNTELGDRPCVVGSSTGIRDTVGSSALGSAQLKCEHSRNISAEVGPLVRPRAMTTSNTSRACTPNNAPSSSASIPSSTTPVKKSSRRNPWGPETYSDLISVAIHSYPDQQATLQQIYDFIITHYEYFRERSDPAMSAGWKNSIRHNLSLHDRFTKCPKSSDNTKSSYWRINTEVASKPYVRRRACSMDNTNNLKRPAGSMKGGNRGAGGGNTRGNRNSVDKLANRSATILNGPTPSSLCEAMQCAPNLTIGSADVSPRFDMRSQQAARQYSKGAYGLPNKIPNYFQHAAPMGKDQELQLSCNGNRWSNLKLSPPGGTAHYPYEQLSSNLLLDSELNSMVGSTDHELVRNRASSLIENLLRSDPSGLDVGSSTVPHLPQPYLPNAPFGHTGLSLPWSTSLNNRPGAMDHSGSSLFSSIAQPHPLDMTPQSTQLRSMSPETSADDLMHHNHLRPLRLQSTTTSSGHSNTHTSESVDAMFGSSWQSYASQFQFPMNNAIPNVSSVYPGFSGISPFPVVHGASGHRPVDGFKPNYDVSSMDHHSASSSVTSTNSMLPFFSSTSTNVVCTASLSPSASSSTSSSTRSWRHVLGLDAQMHGDHSANLPDRSLSNVVASGASGLESRSVTSMSPPVPQYYSPMRPGLPGPFASPDCALDTPPYHQLKQESLENTDGGIDLGIRDRAIDCPKATSPSENYSDLTVTTRSELCSGLSNRCYSEDFTYEEEDDRDKLELELSLELADRIVRSTKSENK